MRSDVEAPGLESTTEVAGQNSLFSPTFKEKCRRALAGGLYYSRILQSMKRLERSHEVSPARFGLPRLLRFSGSKFGILCYHRVGTVGVPFHSTLKPELFEAHMRYVRSRYRVVPLRQICGQLLAAVDVPPTLAITFDDGYRDLYEHAFPILQKYEIPATVYLIGRSMETGEAPWYDRIFASIAVYPGAFLEVELDRV